MKKTTLLKTIVLAAAMMLGGASFADAQTTLYYRTLTGTESVPADAAEQAWATTDYDGTTTGSWSGDLSSAGIDGDKGLSMTSTDGTQTITKSFSYTEGSKLIYDIEWNTGTQTTNSGYPYSYLMIGDMIQLDWASRSNQNGKMTLKIGNRNSETIGYFINAIITIHIEINTYSKDIISFTISGKDKDSNNINWSIESAAKSALNGTNATINTVSLKVLKDTNVPTTYLKTIKVQQEDLYAYSINWKCGDDDMGVFTSGYDENGATISSMPYPGYMCKDHVLYKNSSFVGSTSEFTLTSNNQKEYITGYTAQNVGYVVFCEEAENIDGMTKASTNKRGDRCSGKNAAYCTEDVTIATLPAGTYKIYAGFQGESTGTFTFKAGSTTVWTKEHSTGKSYRVDESSNPFTINETTDIKINGGSSSVAFDNIYIVCTSGRIASVDALGYTFSSTLPLDFTGTDVEAYTAAYNSTSKKVELSRVYKVPANTGLFIKGTADDIPVLTDDADVIGTNNLVAVSATKTVNQTDGDNTNFVLGVDNAADPTAAVFLKAPSAGVSVGAGKAYLQIPTASAPAAARMAVVFNDETTGVSEKVKVNSEEFATAQYYNLSGQRVALPTKGLYIVNGKKVVVK